MKVKFYKYHGAGNDFVMLDNRNGEYSNLSKEQIEFLCHRRFGVGADGLIKLELNDTHDFSMKYYNADGGEAEMCGNGARCIVAFAKNLGLINTNTKFTTMHGVHSAGLTELGVKVEMADVNEVEMGDDYFYLNTGVPHYVKFVSNLAEFNVVEEGRRIRYSERFSEVGTNVNFVELNGDLFDIRTYERGVEDETLACGTGCTASAIAAFLFKKEHQSFGIKALGGKIRVSFDTDKEAFTNVWLEGPAVESFRGELSIS